MARQNSERNNIFTLSIYYKFHENYTQSFFNICHKIVQNYIIILLKLFGEKRFLNSLKVFPENIKSINLIQKYLHIIESYACILKIFVFFVFITDKCSNLFWNMFYTKTIEISNIIIDYIQQNLISYNIRVLIKIYYISLILCFW